MRIRSDNNPISSNGYPKSLLRTTQDNSTASYLKKNIMRTFHVFPLNHNNIMMEYFTDSYITQCCLLQFNMNSMYIIQLTLNFYIKIRLRSRKLYLRLKKARSTVYWVTSDLALLRTDEIR